MPPTIRLRDSVLVFSNGCDRVDFVSTATKVVKSFEADELVFQLIQLLDGTRTEPDVERALSAFTPDALRSVLDVLRDEQLLARPGADDTGELTPRELERYSRQLVLFEELAYGADRPSSAAAFQRRLRDATVAVVGAGGLGSSVLGALAAVGVGRLRVWDPDTVELSNVNRQLLYHPSDCGRPKSEVIAERLKEINELVAVEAVGMWLDDSAPIDDLLDGADVVVNCADQPTLDQACSLVSGAAVRAGIPHLVGGSYAYDLGVLGTTVIPGTTACWECLRQETSTDVVSTGDVVLRGRSGPGPGLAMFSALAANVLAWEVTRLLVGLPSLLAGHWAEIDLTGLEIHRRPLSRHPACAVCGATVREEI